MKLMSYAPSTFQSQSRVPSVDTMSSRGQHVGGTDGTDHQYRERVAAQYGVSATNKARLKLLVSVHYLLGAAHLARLVPHLVKYLGVDLEMPLPPTPAPNSFVEYFWLLSLPFTLMAMMAARKYVVYDRKLW